MADLGGMSRAVRDSKDPLGRVLRVSDGQWSVFTAGLRSGEFD